MLRINIRLCHMHIRISTVIVELRTFFQEVAHRKRWRHDMSRGYLATDTPRAVSLKFYRSSRKTRDRIEGRMYGRSTCNRDEKEAHPAK